MSAVIEAVRTRSALWEPFRDALEKLRVELLRDRRLGWAAVGRFPDSMMLARTRRLDITLDEIEAALARLDAGHLRSVHPLRTQDHAQTTDGAPLPQRL
jgi:hypothetical protein